MAQQHDDDDEPKINDRRKIDPETGEARVEDGDAANDAADVGFSEDDIALLAEAERDLVAEYRERAARAEAELKNFRTRVERDRVANREAVIAEVIRSLLPAIDDLDRADAHGDLVEGAPLTLVAQKLRAGFAKYAWRRSARSGNRSTRSGTRRSCSSRARMSRSTPWPTCSSPATSSATDSSVPPKSP